LKEPILFVNIGWMKEYKGDRPSDRLNAQNFGYFKKQGVAESEGHEQWNFKPHNGTVYGYVPRSSGINITRLGASSTEDRIEGVLVVFIARDAAVKELKVVGWYRDATVCRSAIFKRTHERLQVEAPIMSRQWNILPVADRDHRALIPTAQREKGGVGQSPVWYAESHPDVVDRVRSLVQSVEKRKARRNQNQFSKRVPRNMDPESTVAVELAAMRLAMAHFEGTEDVSKKCRGWDIEATGSDGVLYIEVKGLSGGNVVVELTPNEYEKMTKHRHRYVLFVVTNALSKRPMARTFRFDPSHGTLGNWLSDISEVLELTPRTGARASI